MQIFQFDRKSNIAGSHDILNLEICEFDIKPTIFDNLGILFSGLFGKITIFGSGADNFALKCKKQT